MEQQDLRWVVVSISVLLNGEVNERVEVQVERHGQPVPIAPQLTEFQLALKVKFGPRMMAKLDELIDYLTLRYTYSRKDVWRCVPEQTAIIDYGIAFQWKIGTLESDPSLAAGKETRAVADALIQTQRVDATGPCSMIILKPRPGKPNEGTYRVVGGDPKESVHD